MNRGQANQRKAIMPIVFAVLLVCCVGTFILMLIARQASEPSVQAPAADPRAATLASLTHRKRPRS